MLCKCLSNLRDREGGPGGSWDLRGEQEPGGCLCGACTWSFVQRGAARGAFRKGHAGSSLCGPGQQRCSLLWMPTLSPPEPTPPAGANPVPSPLWSLLWSLSPTASHPCSYSPCTSGLILSVSVFSSRREGFSWNLEQRPKSEALKYSIHTYF